MMRYFVTAVSILLLLAVVWVVFFSGLIWGKKKNAAESPAKTGKVLVVLNTNFGDIKIELDSERTPKTAANFAKLAAAGFYDGVTFHRVIDGFMIQGGDPRGDGTGGPGYMIPDEIVPENRNDRGTISMANAGPNTGGSQFFINLVNNNFLDTKHPAFGRVVSGMEIVDQIAKVATDNNAKPLEPVIIKKAYIEN